MSSRWAPPRRTRRSAPRTTRGTSPGCRGVHPAARRPRSRASRRRWASAPTPAVCGVVGVKPTYGGPSRYGVVAFASSLDTPGPLARTVLDAALLHEAMAGHDPCDSTSVNAPVPPVVAAARQADVSGLTVGVVPELGGEGYQPGVLARFGEAGETPRSPGAQLVEV